MEQDGVIDLLTASEQEEMARMIDDAKDTSTNSEDQSVAIMTPSNQPSQWKENKRRWKRKPYQRSTAASVQTSGERKREMTQLRQRNNRIPLLSNPTPVDGMPVNSRRRQGLLPAPHQRRVLLPTPPPLPSTPPEPIPPPPPPAESPPPPPPPGPPPPWERQVADLVVTPPREVVDQFLRGVIIDSRES